jgi:hypothetical protein
MTFMNTRKKIERDLSEAMRAGDNLRKGALRLLLSAVKLVEIERGAPLDDQAIAAVIRKEIKSRRESIADAERAGRPDLVSGAEAEITFLESYLPKELTEEELEALARDVIAEVGAASLKEMGQVMKVLMPRVEGRVEGARASQIVRRLLE